MTEQERNRQQWKALRAPVIQRAWENRKRTLQVRHYGSYAIPVAATYQACRHIRVASPKPSVGHQEPRRFGLALNLLTAMRAAERAGENALIWKLSH